MPPEDAPGHEDPARVAVVVRLDVVDHRDDAAGSLLPLCVNACGVDTSKQEPARVDDG